MARPNKRKKTGLLLIAAAAMAVLVIWIFATGDEAAETDNAYVRGDVTSLAPKVAGYVVAVEVRDNQAVRRGDVLFRIDDRDYRAKLAQAEANVQAARARVASSSEDIALQQILVRQAAAQHRAASAELVLARKTIDRRLALVDGGAISQAQVDESSTGRSRAEAGLAASGATLDAQRQRIDLLAAQREAALAALAQAEAARDLAKIDLDNTVVRAPVAGVVGNRQVRVGRLVAPGAALLDIVPVADLYLVANFKETQLEYIRPGQSVRIRIDGYPDVAIEGEVDSLAPGSGSAFALIPADNATGNFVRVVQRVPVKIRLRANPLAGRLVPGLSARVEVLRGRRT